MKHQIYAIRDRLIDYFQAPFVAVGDKEVMASLVTVINDKEQTHAIAQAPHQFELWKIGEVTEEGYIVPQRGLIADCSSFVRRDIRNGGAPGERPLPQPVARGARPASLPDCEGTGDGTGDDTSKRGNGTAATPAGHV